jgi:hypothetical protein
VPVHPPLERPFELDGRVHEADGDGPKVDLASDDPTGTVREWRPPPETVH